LVAQMLAGLRKIRALIQNNDETVTEKTVKEVGETCGDLVMAISHRSSS
jgi:hypothetical protein